jgi:hypothetical protein
VSGTKPTNGVLDIEGAIAQPGTGDIIVGTFVLPARPMANFPIGTPVEVIETRVRNSLAYPSGTVRECAVINGAPNNVSLRWYWEGDLVRVVQR